MKKKSPDRDRALVLTNIKRVEREISAAETDLEKVIAGIAVMPRADKVTVSTAVDDAFKRLRAAKTRLDDLEELLTSITSKS